MTWLLTTLLLLAPPKPACDLWLEAEQPATTTFQPGATAAPNAYGGQALRLDATGKLPASADYAVNVPDGGTWRLGICAGRLEAWDSSGLWLTIDDQPALNLNGVPDQGERWGSGTEPNWSPQLSWHDFGQFELARGPHRLRFEAREPAPNGQVNLTLDALCLTYVKPPKLLCQLDFDQGLNPQPGQDEAEVMGEVPLVEHGDGKAAKIGERAGLSYLTKGNLDATSGSIILSFKLLEPAAGRPYWDRLWDVTFGGNNDNAMRLLFQKDDGKLYAVLSSTAEGTMQRYQPPAAMAIEDLEWHQVALTWGRTGTSLWLDGKSLGSGAKYVAPQELPERFWLGNVAEGIGGARALFDDVRIYDAPLSADALRDLMGQAKQAPARDHNLVDNAGFELGQAGWSVMPTGQAVGQWLVEDEADRGKVLKLDTTTGTGPLDLSRLELYGPWRNVVPGTWTTFSVLLRADADRVPVMLHLQNGVIHGLLEQGIVDQRGLRRTVLVGKEWRRYEVGGPLPAGFRDAYRVHLSVPDGHTVWVDDAAWLPGGRQQPGPAGVEVAAWLEPLDGMVEVGAMASYRTAVRNGGTQRFKGTLRATIKSSGGPPVGGVTSQLDLAPGEVADAHASGGVFGQRGSARLEVVVRDAKGQPVANAEAPFVVVKSLTDVDPNSPFLLHDGGAQLLSDLDRVKRMGVVKIRNAGNTLWNWAERKQGEWTWRDAYHQRFYDQGLSLFGMLGFAPPWARREEAGPNWRQTRIPPRDLDEWRNYVKVTVSRLKGQIDEWEIWNEPNARSFFSGSPQDYAELCKAAYPVAKQANPNAVLMGMSLASLSDQALKFGEAAMDAGALQGMDMISFHPYQNQIPEIGLADKIERLRSMARAHGRDLPLVNSEVGWQGTDTFDPGQPYFPSEHTNPPPTEVEQAAILVRSYVICLAHGVKRYYWYKWFEERGDVGPDIFGLIRADWQRSPKAGVATFNAMVERLDRHEFVDRAKLPDDQVHVYRFKRGEQTTTVAWTVGEGTTLPGQAGRLYDLYGNDEGQIAGAVKLGRQPVYLVR